MKNLISIILLLSSCSCTTFKAATNIDEIEIESEIHLKKEK